MSDSAGRGIGQSENDYREVQREVLAFLSRGESYGYPGAIAERIETHCSTVFLIGGRAYKIKHALAFASLDYTTVERREQACRAELLLNRRTAPEIYIDVMPISRSARGILSFYAIGTTVDWVVVMQRFDQADLFDRMATGDRLTTERVSSLAEEIARFHGTAEIMPEFGGAAGMRRAIDHNLRELLIRTSLRDGGVARDLHRRSLAAFDRVAALLDDRRRRGFVRRCHGDLRLANICLFRGRPTLFDCIEFSDEISCIDTLYDLAFLLMDLRHRGLDAVAEKVLARYVECTGDEGGLPALPLFLSVRAATRSYAVAGSAMRQRDARAAARLNAAAQSLLGLAEAFLAGDAPAAAVPGGGA